MTSLSEIVYLQSVTMMAVAIIFAVASFSASFALSYVASRFLESAARQPEIANKLFTQALGLMAMIDVVPMLTCIMAIMALTSAPLTAKVLSALPQLL